MSQHIIEVELHHAKLRITCKLPLFHMKRFLTGFMQKCMLTTIVGFVAINLEIARTSVQDMRYVRLRKYLGDDECSSGLTSKLLQTRYLISDQCISTTNNSFTARCDYNCSNTNNISIEAWQFSDTCENNGMNINTSDHDMIDSIVNHEQNVCLMHNTYDFGETKYYTIWDCVSQLPNMSIYQSDLFSGSSYYAYFDIYSSDDTDCSDNIIYREIEWINDFTNEFDFACIPTCTVQVMNLVLVILIVIITS